MRTDILDRKEEIAQWIAQGKSKAEIARMLSCSSNTLEA
ncbi:LuxR C-terminal-related transcriptional regulator, partial [Enterococcus faecalis]